MNSRNTFFNSHKSLSNTFYERIEQYYLLQSRQMKINKINFSVCISDFGALLTNYDTLKRRTGTCGTKNEIL